MTKYSEYRERYEPPAAVEVDEATIDKWVDEVKAAIVGGEPIYSLASGRANVIGYGDKDKMWIYVIRDGYEVIEYKKKEQTTFDTIVAFKYGDDIVSFLSSVREAYDEHYGKWYQEDNDGEITVELRTGGWSKNEKVIDALLSNFQIKSLFYDSWERGGRYVFKFYMPEK